jgi:hypothetical protein
MAFSGIPQTPELRRLIERLADAFVPLEQWVSSKLYNPAPKSPWRTGQPLNASNLAFADFFEGLLRETSGDNDLKDRWDAFDEAPLARCPILDVGNWRANRGLAALPRFAVAISDAVIVDTETRQISRAEFYSDYWPLLADAYQAADTAATMAGTKTDETAFAAGLLGDNNPFWPQAGQWRSSRFSKQFVKDVLYGYLGLRGVAPEPWCNAILIELGEGRRIGNKYTSDDAAKAVEEFNEVLSALRQKGAAHPLADVAREYFEQPIGSPPVNARDL